MTRLPSLLLSLFAAALMAQAPTTVPPLRIGTWNLEFLGDPANHRDKLPPRDDADFAKIGAYVRELGVAVLAVQEICGDVPLRRVANAAGPSWDLVLGTTGGWDDGKTAQNIGFLYDTARVELLSAEELLDFPRQRDGVPIFHRVPVTACFRDRRSGCDFRAVTVHLKASTKPDDLKKRRLEASVLRDWLLLLENGEHEDQDIVVLGDFNSTYGADPETILEEAGAVRYLRPAQPTPTIMHFAEPIDQIAPSTRFQEVQARTFAVHGEGAKADPVAWRKTYSDHFPVTVDLQADRDDDPDASFSQTNRLYALPTTKRAAAAPGGGASDRSAPRRGGDETDSRRSASTATLDRRAATAIDVGDHVSVKVAGQDTPLSGTLLAPLGDWIYLRTNEAVDIAVPVHQVLYVSKTAAR